ncbi:MAG: radical SAM protein, partial [Deltaproteobacteria bacterium]|nr:radical SAM protein [Deltaproteobacteria bacterium]
MNLRYHWERYRNLKLNRKEFRERKTHLESYPSIAYFDATNICPLSCPLCPTGQKDGGAPRGTMTMETFKRIYDEVGPYLYELHLYNWGEPLLNRGLVDMIRYAKKDYNPNIVISTTLSKIPREWALEVMRSGVDMISVSIDGATQETYGKYRVGGRFDEVIGTLSYISGVKKAEGLKKPRLRWQFIPMKHNEKEIEAARKRAAEIGVEFRTHRVRINVSSFDNKDLSSLVAENRDWLPENPKYIRYGKKQQRPVCKYLWDRVVFNWDGSVAPCCKIYNRADSFAEAVRGDFMEIWNAASYVKAREIFNGKQADKGFVCQRCVDH